MGMVPMPPPRRMREKNWSDRPLKPIPPKPPLEIVKEDGGLAGAIPLYSIGVCGLLLLWVVIEGIF